jgi:hypothetical protein
LVVDVVKMFAVGKTIDLSLCVPILNWLLLLVDHTLTSALAVYPDGMFAPPYTLGAVVLVALVASNALAPVVGL